VADAPVWKSIQRFFKDVENNGVLESATITDNDAVVS
jgi:hypothetical protein